MRRTCNAAREARTADCLEATRRLYRSVTEIVKRLDEQKSHALKITDIFTPSGEVLRAKLKDYCERLILKDPVGSARKTEELLWRKVFYNVVCTAKNLRKDNVWNDTEKALLSTHLTVGVGYYHHLILKLQSEYDLDLIGVIDFAFVHNESFSSHVKTKTGQPKIYTKEVKQCIMRLIHRSLVCLGDLSRYKLELVSDWDPMIANRYYKMAIAIDPNIGMPHNQLGSLAGNKNYGLDAVYHYMRGVLCIEPFEGAEDNLRRSIVNHIICTDENNSVHHCVSRLFSLLRLWDQENPNSDQINQECQDLLTNIENCLMEQFESDNANLENMDNVETYPQNCENKPTLYLAHDMIFKIVTICLMSISRLKNKESNEVQDVVAITLAILSHLLQFTITRLQDSIIDMAMPKMAEFIKAGSCPEKFKNKQINELTEQEHNIEHINEQQSMLEKDNNITDLNGNGKVFTMEKENPSNNGILSKGSKKTREKTKNLLSKFRRRKRRSSSDSDTSDIEHATLISSSDEINSEVSETEDEGLSDVNDLSDDNTDDEEEEEPHRFENVVKKEINGHNNTVDIIEDCAKQNINHLVNGEQHINDEQTDSKSSDKESVTNSSSAATITTNTDSTSIFEENSSSSNTVVYVTQLKKQSLGSDEILNILTEREILSSIKVCCDWLKSNPDILKICTNSSRTLLKRVTILLNLINIDTEILVQENCVDDSMILASVEKLKDSVKIVPLPEDIALRGINLLEDSHKSLDWEILHKHKMSRKEEMLLRALKLIEFGHYLNLVENSGVKYDQIEQMFVTIDSNPSNVVKTKSLDKKSFNSEHSKGKLMRHMGKLWLKAEVRALESRLRFRLMSPYLVPDHEALIKHTATLKRLLYARKFIVIIPAVVVSALDEMKSVSAQSREVTRWLELQLKRGSRFLRAQRPHERLALPLVKGPRPKDKEAWLFFQIIECCHYLTQQAKVCFTGDGEAPVVTLLTGCNPEDRKTLTFSPDGLAKTAGVNFEHIESFQTKWKSSSKRHG